MGEKMSRRDDEYDEVSAALDIYDDVGIFDDRDEKIEKDVDRLLDGIDLEQSLKNFVSIFIGN
jgi:hypothetical protein